MEKIGLKPQYLVFAHAYAKGFTPEEAAIKAGYSKQAAKRASRLLHNPLIADYIEKLQKDIRNKVSTQCCITEAQVLAMLHQICLHELQEIPLLDENSEQVLNTQGEPVTQYLSCKNALKALEEMCNILGFTKDKKELTITTTAIDKAQRDAAVAIALGETGDTNEQEISESK